MGRSICGGPAANSISKPVGRVKAWPLSRTVWVASVGRSPAANQTTTAGRQRTARARRRIEGLPGATAYEDAAVIPGRRGVGRVIPPGGKEAGAVIAVG